MGDTFKTYEAIGRREDLSEIVTSIAPVDALLYNAIGSVDVKNTKHEWMTDTLAAAASNAAVEAADATTATQVPTTRLYNMTQILQNTFQISGSNEVAISAGNVTKEDYLTAKNMKQLMKDVEYAYLLGVRADGDATTARTMRGALNWTTTNLDKASDATLAASGAVTGGTARRLPLA